MSYFPVKDRVCWSIFKLKGRAKQGQQPIVAFDSKITSTNQWPPMQEIANRVHRPHYWCLINLNVLVSVAHL
jgi:hypothetical protein